MRVRDALVWCNPARASALANVDGYLLAPVVGLGLLSIGTLANDPTSARAIDDLVPVFESIVLTEVAAQIVKFSVGRQRPYAHFGDPRVPVGLDDNVSFFSGHASLAFTIATSAGTIAHARGYAAEPAIWTAGLAIAASTAYLRIAADKHYLSDVVVGSAVGAAAGLVIPRMMHREDDLSVVPTGRGVALAGTF